MSIYDNPKEYAEKTSITLEQANVRCKYYKELENKVNEARKCPECGGHTLELESGSYYEGTSDFIYCDNEENDCEFTSNVTEQFEPLLHGYDFDIVLYFGVNDIQQKDIKEVEDDIGCSWFDFVEKHNKEIIS